MLQCDVNVDALFWITVFYIIICRGVVSAEALRLFLRPLRCLCGASAVVSAASAAPLRFYVGILFHVQIDFNSTSRSTSILRPDRPQFYVQFDFNFTSNSISILRPIRPQFHVQFDLNFTSNSTSILHPIRPQFYIQIGANGTRFFADGTKLGGHETPTRDSKASST